MVAKNQKLSMSDRAALAAADKKRELPGWWKVGRYILLTYSTICGSLYASGLFTSLIYECKVAISTFDEFMYMSILFCGVLGLILTFAGDVFMEK